MKGQLIIIWMLYTVCAQKIELVGHRGMRGSIPENTILAFESAIKSGVDMVELDVRLCKTGELVVMHDSTIDRVSDGGGYVKQLSLSELKKVSLSHNQTVSTLAEVLEFINRRCRVNIELKGKNTAQQTANVIKFYIDCKGWIADDFIVSSFNLYELFAFKNISPGIKTGLIFEHLPIDYVRISREFGATSLMMSYSLITERFVADAGQHNINIYAWTVNDQIDVNCLCEYGVRGIITDWPDKITVSSAQGR